MFGSLITFFQNRLIQSIMFWAVSFFVLLNLFTRTEHPGLIDVIYTSLFHIPLLVAVLVNSVILIPKFLSQGRNLLYLSLLAPLFLLVYITYSITFNILSDWIFQGYYFVAIYNPLEILGFFTIYIGITSLLEFSKSWFREAEINQQLAEAKQEQAETELKALRAQINPHFLFNSLNHVYSLAVRQSPETGPAILKLSEMLRYSIRNMNEKKVKLAEELNYVRQYVELYKSRVQYPERIHLSIDGQESKLRIPPLLLIVFVENCFKHGSIKKPENKIEIKITIQDSALSLTTQNTVDLQRELPTESNGLGLENVKRRLKLLYPDKHNLITNKKDEIYSIKLTIELQ